MKKLGDIIFPEQYAPVGKEVMVKDSLDALARFEGSYPVGGNVILGTIRFKHLEFPELPIWLYFALKGDRPTLHSSIPVFKVDFEKIINLRVLDVIPYNGEIFLFWNNVLYSSVITSANHIVIKKVRLLLSETSARQVLETQFATKIVEMFPVVLYSHFEHRYVGVCWAVLYAADDTSIYWYPIYLDDLKKLATYAPEDLSDHPINVGETVVIGSGTYCLQYTENSGFYFCKTGSKNGNKILKVPFSSIISASSTTGHQQKTMIFPLHPKK